MSSGEEFIEIKLSEKQRNAPQENIGILTWFYLYNPGWSKLSNTQTTFVLSKHFYRNGNFRAITGTPHLRYWASFPEDFLMFTLRHRTYCHMQLINVADEMTHQYGPR